MRRHGAFLIEMLIAIFIFTIAIAAVVSTLGISVKLITNSGISVKSRQDTINSVETDLLKRALIHEGSPSGVLLASGTMSIGGGNLEYSLYRYPAEGKKGSSFYVIQRKDSLP